MAPQILRIGLIGAGANMRLRHIPGLRALADVEIVAVCNRRASSAQAVAREYGIPRVIDRWEDLVGTAEMDAVVVGTWPNLHRPITLAALEAGKHVLTEARMSLNAAEAHEMLKASQRHRHLVTQIVPSPYGLAGTDVVAEMLQSGFVGELREIHVCSLSGALADAAAPLSWRQDVSLSGFNMLTLGILHETLLRWVPRPVRVLAQVHAFVPARIDPESGVRRPTGTPDSVQVLAVLENGARAVYHFSGVTPFGQAMSISFFGTGGVLHYDLMADRLKGASRHRGATSARFDQLEDVPIPKEKALSWRVEADFVDAIRHGTPIRFTNFATGVDYMEFTEAVARSAQLGTAVELPLEEFLDDAEKGE
jgi:predicted dehydrogenase